MYENVLSNKHFVVGGLRDGFRKQIQELANAAAIEILEEAIEGLNQEIREYREKSNMASVLASSAKGAGRRVATTAKTAVKRVASGELRGLPSPGVKPAVKPSPKPQAAPAPAPAGAKV